MNLPKAPDWLYWVVATAWASFMLTVFAYANFTTKSEFDGFINQLIHRIDRIEEKLDRVLDKSTR